MTPHRSLCAITLLLASCTYPLTINSTEIGVTVDASSTEGGEVDARAADLADSNDVDVSNIADGGADSSDTALDANAADSAPTPDGGTTKVWGQSDVIPTCGSASFGGHECSQVAITWDGGSCEPWGVNSLGYPIELDFGAPCVNGESCTVDLSTIAFAKKDAGTITSTWFGCQ